MQSRPAGDPARSSHKCVRGRRMLVLGLRCCLLATLASSAGALDNGVGLVPAAGWSSWNVFGGGVTAEAVMGMADVMVEKGAPGRRRSLPRGTPSVSVRMAPH